MSNRTMISRLLFLVIAAVMSTSVFSEDERRLFDHFDTTFPLTGMHTDVNCSACHINGVFKGTPQQCGQCHNGILATGKSANHLHSDDNCDNCHTTFDMADARFEHDNITAPCASCHNGVTATGKTPDHMATTLECDACHTTTTWLNARMDHSMITEPCISCHNNIDATGKPSDHPLTSDDCTLCHTTISWSAVTFVHSSIGNHNPTVTCTDCHIGGNYSSDPWVFSQYAPDCAACHADDYLADKHKKTEVPGTILYTVDELRDCSGSCHLYQDNNFTTIKEIRTGEHQINANDF